MQLGVNTSSPVRTTNALDNSNSPLAGVARKPAAQRRLTFPQPPSTPNRPALCTRHHNVPPSTPPRDRTVAAPASYYTSRQGQPAEGAARRDDDEHSSSLLILLLTLSVVLLTLPWVVDHPVTLLVPVALLILPFTSGALRSMLYEGFSLVSGGLRWFWRHRKAEPNSQQQPSPQAGFQPGNTTWQQTVPQPVYNGQQFRPNSFHFDHRGTPHSSMVVPSPPIGADGRMCDRGEPVSRLRPAVAATGMGPPPMAGSPSVCQLASSGPDLVTPDLDFDSDFDRETSLPGPLHVGPDGNERRIYRNPQPRQASTDDAAECTVYNWDIAEECAQRPGHRPLSELMSNGQ